MLRAGIAAMFAGTLVTAALAQDTAAINSECSRKASELGLTGTARVEFRAKCKAEAGIGSAAKEPAQREKRGKPQTASFDCSQAKSASARLICSDKELSELDRRLAVPFRKRLSQTSGTARDAIIAEQRRWINERNAKCGLTGKDNEPIEVLLSAKDCMNEEIRARTSVLASAPSEQMVKSDPAPTNVPSVPTGSERLTYKWSSNCTSGLGCFAQIDESEDGKLFARLAITQAPGRSTVNLMFVVGARFRAVQLESIALSGANSELKLADCKPIDTGDAGRLCNVKVDPKFLGDMKAAERLVMKAKGGEQLGQFIFPMEGLSAATAKWTPQQAFSSDLGEVNPAAFSALRAILPSSVRNAEWIYELKGVVSPMEEIVFDDVKYLVGSSCKPKDCGDNMFVFMAAVDGSRAVATLNRAGAVETFGKPVGAVQLFLKQRTEAAAPVSTVSIEQAPSPIVTESPQQPPVVNPEVIQGVRLPSDAVQALIRSIKAGSCTKLPIGRFSWGYDNQTRRPNGPYGGELDTALFYERQGFLTIAFAGHMIGAFGSFDVTLRFPIDGRMFKKSEQGICIDTADLSRATGNVIRAEEVRGGRTGWKGVIAYIKITGFGCAVPPPNVPKICRNDPADIKQYRALFREKPFGDGWIMLAFDFYLQDKFLTERVLNALQTD